MILRGLLGDDTHVDAFVDRIGTELKKVAADPDVVKVSEKINEPLRDLTVGAHPQMSELTLAEPTFASIARSLRMLLGDASAQPSPHSLNAPPRTFRSTTGPPSMSCWRSYEELGQTSRPPCWPNGSLLLNSFNSSPDSAGTGSSFDLGVSPTGVLPLHGRGTTWAKTSTGLARLDA
ncbi:hypothetical protein ACW69C_33055 [Streptomyces sp. MN3]